MDDKKNDEVVILTEVGVFGSINIEDPTVQKINKKQKGDPLIDDVIKEAIIENYNKLTNV